MNLDDEGEEIEFLCSLSLENGACGRHKYWGECGSLATARAF
jgi:hypothetical protein